MQVRLDNPYEPQLASLPSGEWRGAVCSAAALEGSKWAPAERCNSLRNRVDIRPGVVWPARQTLREVARTADQPIPSTCF
jgi:hypothetical protein